MTTPHVQPIAHAGPSPHAPVPILTTTPRPSAPSPSARPYYQCPKVVTD